MGIKNLSSLYRDDDTVTKRLHLENFRGKRLAIDAGIWLNSMWASACSRHIDEIDIIGQQPDQAVVMTYWLERVVDELQTLLSYHIVPLVVFDGKAPDDKAVTAAKRREDVSKARQRLSYLEEKREDGIYSSEDIVQARKIVKAARTVPMVQDDVLDNLLRAIGIPTLRAKGEAERLCASLCRQGWAWAVLSSDSDCLTHGCTMVVSKMLGHTCTVIHLYPLLAKLGLTFTQFVDLCIMCGCDYNTNIPQVGVQRSLNLIREYGSIDNLPDKYDTSPLNYQRCRELFALVDPEELTDDLISDQSVNLTPIPDHARDVLDSYNASYWLERLVPLLSAVDPIPRLSYIRPPQPVYLKTI